MFIAEKMAHMAAALTFDALPEKTVAQTKRAIIDYLGNSLAGIHTREGKLIGKYVRNYPEGHLAAYWGGGNYNLEKAAFGNGLLSRVIDLDDGHKNATGHPGTAVISAVMTLADYLKSDAKQIIPAVVMGYEVYIRIARGLHESAHREKGYDMTGICGTSAAAVASAMLLGLDEQGILNAFGIAGSYSGGLYECLANGSDPKLLVPGWAAMTGINAALLAKEGFTGPNSIIEGKKGLAQGVTNFYDFDRVFDDFGLRYEIDGIYFKRYACMRGTHGGIDAVLNIRDENKLSAEDIKAIHIFTSSYVKQYDKAYPKTLVGAQSNLPFAISVGLYNKIIGLEEMEAGLKEERIQNMMKKIDVTVLPKWEEYMKAHFEQLTTANAVVETVDGRKFENTVYLASGEPENPIPYEYFKEKFFTLSQKTIEKPASERLFELVMNMDTLNDMKEVFEIMANHILYM